MLTKKLCGELDAIHHTILLTKVFIIPIRSMHVTKSMKLTKWAPYSTCAVVITWHKHKAKFAVHFKDPFFYIKALNDHNNYPLTMIFET